MDQDRGVSSTAQANKQREYLAKVTLTGVFFLTLAGFIGYMTFFGPGLDAFQLGAMDLTLLALSAFRLGRLVAYDRVFEPFRQFFTETLPDPTGAGDTVEPKGTGFRQSLGQLICCPICSGTWIAAGLVYLLFLFPGPTRVFLAMTAAIGAAELLNALAEALSWTGQAARVASGAPTRAQWAREKAEQERAEAAAPVVPAVEAARQVVSRQPVQRYTVNRDAVHRDTVHRYPVAHDTEEASRIHALRIHQRRASEPQPDAARLSAQLGDAGYQAECHDETRLLKAQQRAALGMQKSLSRRRALPHTQDAE